MVFIHAIRGGRVGRCGGWIRLPIPGPGQHNSQTVPGQSCLKTIDVQTLIYRRFSGFVMALNFGIIFYVEKVLQL